jgi:coatomer subunit gamma
VKDCDPTTGLPDSDEGYDDEYMLEDLEITVADQIQKTKKNNFMAAWDAADTEGEERLLRPGNVNFEFIFCFPEWVEAEDTYSLAAVKTLQEAVNTILKFLGLSPANMTEKVAEGTHTHTLLCSGKFILALFQHTNRFFSKSIENESLMNDIRQKLENIH